MTSEELLIYWINKVNKTRFVVGELTFSDPEDNPDTDFPVDTRISATAADGQKVGSMYLYYQRSSLPRIFPYTRVSINVDEYQRITTTRQLYEVLSERHKLLFDATEIEDVALPAEIAGEKTVTFTAMEFSKVLKGTTTFKLAHWAQRT